MKPDEQQAPERIWIDRYWQKPHTPSGIYYTSEQMNTTEYVRADLLPQPASERFRYEAELKNRYSNAVRLLRQVKFAFNQISLHFREDVAAPVVNDYETQAKRIAVFLDDVASKPLSEPASERCGERYCIHCGRRDTNADYCGKQRGLQKCVFATTGTGEGPPTEARQVAVEAAAKEIAETLVSDNQPYRLRDNDGAPIKSLNPKFFVAIISKHCSANAGEIERLRAEIRRAMDVLQPNMPENGLEDACRQRMQAYISECDNAEEAERLLTTARADAIRECMERLGRFGSQMRKVDAITALESLTKKEGDDGRRINNPQDVRREDSR